MIDHVGQSSEASANVRWTFKRGNARNANLHDSSSRLSDSQPLREGLATCSHANVDAFRGLATAEFASTVAIPDDVVTLTHPIDSAEGSEQRPITCLVNRSFFDRNALVERTAMQINL